MVWPLAAGVSVAAAAMIARYGVEAVAAWSAAGAVSGGLGLGRRYYDGGFEPKMTRREAALILAVREHAAEAKIKDAHRRIMIANHPDAGGSDFLAAKINEAKDTLLNKRRSGGSAF
mmetsp:Transcript_14078/g.51136  ORF Transcript_14078/g.51136 Transcript_14078/m.51136 type:complete len:117 (-) Transcript_14078:1330-1680(-)